MVFLFIFLMDREHETCLFCQVHARRFLVDTDHEVWRFCWLCAGHPSPRINKNRCYSPFRYGIHMPHVYFHHNYLELFFVTPVLSSFNWHAHISLISLVQSFGLIKGTSYEGDYCIQTCVLIYRLSIVVMWFLQFLFLYVESDLTNFSEF